MRRVILELKHATQHWERRRASEIPDYLMVPAPDGKPIKYVLEVPHPSVLKALENIRNMKQMMAGYQWRGESAEKMREEEENG